MRFIKKIGEEEMVLAFLKAEIKSPRYKSHVEYFLQRLGHTKDLIEKANLINPTENQARLTCLDYRGFRNRQYLFLGFPHNVSWERAYLNKKELGNLKYIKDLEWIKLSAITRLVVDGAKNIYSYSNDKIKTNVKAVQELIKSGNISSELILASKDKNSDIFLVEGHVRATAYELTKDHLPNEFEVIVGYSKNLTNWFFY